jgi:hypothetical protein
MTEDDTNMIAYCGLYCEECPSYTGIIPDLARDLRKALRTYRYDKISGALAEMGYPMFDVYKNYQAAYDVMGALVKMRCGKGCKGGGGNPFCKIRKCAQKQEYSGCWDCDGFKNCSKLDELLPTHGDAHRKNVRIIKRKGVDGFLKGKKNWYTKPKG